MPRYYAIPRVGPRAFSMGDLTQPDASTFPLGGSNHVWFDTVLERTLEGWVKKIPAVELPEADRNRLSQSHADLCGVTLDQPRILGILNVTPDSFSDKGQFKEISAAVERAHVMSQQVDILDIGGESTRPGAKPVEVEEELRRTAPAIRAIREAGITTPISIDTSKAAVARAALEAGANMVNDVTAMRGDPDMISVVADFDVPICLMHSRGTPENSIQFANYQDVLCEIYDHLAVQIDVAVAAGIRREHLIVDPGIGFGKKLEHNLALVRGLSFFHDLGAPIMLGASRKGFIGVIGEAEEPKDRLGGSLAVALEGAMQGAQILRVHDTYATRQALRLQLAIQQDD